MEETNEELPNFSIGIVLLRPDPRAAAKIKPNLKIFASCAFRKFVGRPSAASFGRETFTGNRKDSNWSLTTIKGKIYVFIVVFKFVMHFCYRQTIRLNQENFSCNIKQDKLHKKTVLFLLIKKQLLAGLLK